MARAFAKKIYNSSAWKKVRKGVLMRDKYMCQCSLCKGEGLPAEEVHHIQELSPDNAHIKAIVFDDKNLVALARDCHFRIHAETKIKSDTSDGFYFDECGMLQIATG